MSAEVLISDLRPTGYGIIPLQVATCAELRTVGECALRVWLVLACRANDARGGWAWSLTALERDTGIERRNLQRAIARLVAVGLLSRETGSGRASTFYRLTMPPSLVGGVVKSTANGPMDNRGGGAVKSTTPGAVKSSTPRQDTEQTPIQDPPYPPQAGGHSGDRALAGRRTDPASVYARKHRIPVARARVELEREERHTQIANALLEAIPADLRTHGKQNQLLGVLRSSGFLPGENVARDYLREYGKAPPGRLHGPVTWEPPAELAPWMLWYAVDCYARDALPNACLEDRPVGYWLAHVIGEVTCAA